MYEYSRRRIIEYNNRRSSDLKIEKPRREVKNTEMAVSIQMLELVLRTFENQIQILRQIATNDTPKHRVHQENEFHHKKKSDDEIDLSQDQDTSYLAITLKMKDQEIDELQRENQKLRDKIESILLNMTPRLELQNEYQRGFNEGMKVAQKEQVVTELNTDMDEEIEEVEETSYNAEEDVVDHSNNVTTNVIESKSKPKQEHNKNASAQEETNVESEPEPDAEEEEVDEECEEGETEQNNDVADREDQPEEDGNDEIEEEVDEVVEEEVEEEDDDNCDELAEVEFNGKTYYFHEETGQIFLPNSEGEIDLEKPAGIWSDKKADFVLFRR